MHALHPRVCKLTKKSRVPANHDIGVMPEQKKIGLVLCIDFDNWRLSANDNC